MLEQELLATLFSLAAAIAWGSGDFSGGLAVKRHNAYSVLLTSQAISLLPLIALILWFEPFLPSQQDVLLGMLTGIFVMLALMHFYIGLAKGRMSVVAPVAAIIACVIPVMLGMWTQGLPSPLQLGGFALALLAVWLLSNPDSKLKASAMELRYALISGLCFAGVFICLHSVSGETRLWPVFTARATSMVTVGIYTFTRGYWVMPSRPLLPLIALAGLFDVLGSYCFVMASHAGRLDMVTLFASLYPAVTVLLAWLIIKEQLEKKQWAGVLTSFIAIGLLVL